MYNFKKVIICNNPTKKTLLFMTSFYGWDSLVSRPIEPLRGDSLLYSIKSPPVSGTNLINHGKMKS